MNKKIIDKMKAIFIVAIMFLGTSIIIQVNAMPPDPGPAPDVINLYFSYSQPEITPISLNGTIYHQVRMDDKPVASDYGVPILPIEPVNVLLPQCGEVSSIEVVYEGNTSLGYGYNVELGSYPESYNSSNPPPPPILNISDPYPPGLFYDCDVQDLRGYSIQTLTLNPVHYIAATGEIYYYQRMNVTIATTPTGEISPNFRGLPEDEMIMEQLVDNSIMFDTYISRPTHIFSPIVDPSDSYDYVIITTRALRDYNGPGNDDDFQDLVDYKNQLGTKATIVAIEDIYIHYSGVDDEEKIRNFIKHAYNGWEIEYVLIGGDDDVVPVRHLYAKIHLEVGYIPSDLYYACLDRNYDHDGDQIWGEFGDRVDFLAEVFIGRTCVGDVSELSNFVKKTIKYWDTTDSYLEEILFVGEELNLDPPPHYWGGDYMDELLDGCSANGYITVGIPSGYYNYFKLYDRDWYNNYWGVSEIINRINNNVHIINHIGHSEPIKNMRMYKHNINDLTNNKPCFLYTQGCNAGRFTWETEDCIGEHLTVKTDKGLFAAIMFTTVGFQDPRGTNGPTQHYQRMFWHSIFGKGEKDPLWKEIGPANQYSKEKNLWRLYVPYNFFPYPLGLKYNRYIFFSITVFGDPQIYIKTPEEPDPEWISPNGFIPSDAWRKEEHAIDRNTFTKAKCTIDDYEWTWTPFLELTFQSPIDSSKIRFYSWYNLRHCKWIDVDAYYNGGWQHVYEGSYAKYTWVEKPIDNFPQSSASVSKVRVRFNVHSWLFWPVTAKLNEIQIYQVSP